MDDLTGFLDLVLNSPVGEFSSPGALTDISLNPSQVDNSSVETPVAEGLFSDSEVNTPETNIEEDHDSFELSSTESAEHGDGEFLTDVKLNTSELPPNEEAVPEHATDRDLPPYDGTGLTNEIGDYALNINPNLSSLVQPSEFEADGSFDPTNKCDVIGEVARDIPYVDRQTHGSCSLMAQEQFVERYIGEDVPESYLEWLGEEWKVYSPEGGTNFFGQDKVLDHFGVPHTRNTFAAISDLDEVTSRNNDVIIGVDARHFYDDPTIPSGSGHAVSIVGKGVDPQTRETTGYYFTDSNYPGTARFLSVAEVEDCWWNDMIVVPA